MWTIQCINNKLSTKVPTYSYRCNEVKYKNIMLKACASHLQLVLCLLSVKDYASHSEVTV